MHSLNNIRERLNALEGKTTEAFTEIINLYQNYLNQLESAVKYQLVFAVHHIATQIHPEIFLALSFSQRQKFQTKIRQIAKEFRPKLTIILASQGIHLDNAPLSNLAIAEKQSSEKNNLEEELLPHAAFNVKTPEDLLQWYRAVEQAIHRVLDSLSQETNKVLQSVEIVNNKLPSQLLEMALHAEDSGINIGRAGSPNILNLVIEARREREEPHEDLEQQDDDEDDEDHEDDNEDRQENSEVMKITAIHLRLTEIEFADPNLSVSRKQLRYLGEQINKLRKHYKSLKREYLQSEAELAWKASWMED